MNEILHDITLRNFRSYSEASYELEDGVNIIVGPNASGKTNLLEAVHCVCFGKGVRGTDSGLIKNGEEWLRVDARTGDNERSFIVEKDNYSVRSKKKFIINGKQIPRLKFDTIIPVVVFQPDDLRLTTGSPERRRDYLDKILSQTVPTYKSDLLAYERILKQRNTALKNNLTNTSQLFAWNIQLADKGNRLVSSRVDLVEDINKYISEVYSSVAGRLNDIKISYSTNISINNYSQNLLSLLEKNINLDKDRGTTSVGPHRDDLLISINNENMKNVASRGENRTFLLALKILELNLLEKVHERKPIILLDDVFSELDGLRRKMLTSYLRERQTIITTTDADITTRDFMNKSNIIALESRVS